MTMLQYTLNSFCDDISNKRFHVLRLDLSKNGHIIAALQSQLHLGNGNKSSPGDDTFSYYDDQRLVDMVKSSNFYSGKWTRFNIMIVSFLKFCQNIDPWSSWNSCDSIFQFYSDLNNCILNDTYPVDELIDIFIENTEYVIPFAELLDSNYRYLQVKRFQFLSYTSSVISRTFNSIKSQYPSSNIIHNQNDRLDQLDSTLSKKQQILLYLVNKLNNIYFMIQSPQLCSNIFRNFKPKSSIKNFNEYPMWQQIEYRYLLGRFYLLNNRVSNSFVQLNTSFNLLFKSYQIMNILDDPRSKRNLQRILKYLIPLGVIMGKLPNLSFVSKILVEEENSLNYKELIQYVRSGNIFMMNQWLNSNEIILRKRHLFLILLEKLPMITYRYLLRRVIQIWSIEQHLNRLPYDIFEKCLRMSIKDDTEPTNISIFNSIHKSKNVENILVTLINLGYLRGNCFPLLQLCVFQRTTDINDILPSIENRMLTMFPLNHEDSWLDN